MGSSCWGFFLLENGSLSADVSFVKKTSRVRTRKLLMLQIEGITIMSHSFQV
jgi:hypothetical protein